MNSLTILPGNSQPVSVSLADESHLEYCVPDSFRHGISQVEMQLSNHRHPLDHHLKNYENTQNEWKAMLASKIYGEAPAVHMEQQIHLQRIRGASHMHLPRLSLEIIQGKDWDMDFEDFLGVPKYSTESLNPVSVLERQCGINC